MTLSEEERECFLELRTSEYEQFKDRNPDRLEGTCQWFLQHDHFQNWRQSDTSGLLWVSADPGCGKSVLSKYIADVGLTGTASRSTCYFFFKDDNDKQKSITTALSALLHQLFSQRRSLIQYSMRDYESEGSQLVHSFHKLWSILTKAAVDPEAGEVICILDALDECEVSGRYTLINALNTFYKTTSSAGSQSQLKFLVTSRPYYDIERRFAELAEGFPMIRLQGEKESEAISREINIVIKWKVSELRLRLNLDDSETSLLESELLGTAHWTYLWLKLILEVIHDEIGITKKKLRRITGTLPSTIDQAYDAILSKVRDRKKVRKLLSIIVAATRLLTLREMNIALAIEDHHRSDEDFDLENETRFGTTIRNLCGLFVSVVGGKVCLIHQTAEGFLVAKSRVLGGWGHPLDLVESELLLARTCIAYLMFATFGNGLIEKIETYGFLLYAANSWATHYRQAQARATSELLQSVLDICDTHSPQFRNWYSVYQNAEYSYPGLPSTSTIMVASYFGHDTAVKFLLEMSKPDVDSKDAWNGRTPLLWAAGNRHETVVELLLASNAEVDSKNNNGRTSLSFATSNKNEAVVKLLLASKAEVDSRDNQGRTPLSWAAGNGCKAVFELLLASEAKVYSEDNNGRTLLSWAATNRDIAVVELILASKAEVDSKDNNGRTPLSWATSNKNEAIVKLLLASKAEVDSRDNQGRTPLSWAATNSNEAVVKLLLARKAEVNSSDRAGHTPLSWAAISWNMTVFKLLLEACKAGVDAKYTDYALNPLLVAIQERNYPVVNLLLDMGEAEVNKNDAETPLTTATEKENEAMVRMLLKVVNVNTDSRYIARQIPLTWAVKNRRETVVKLLLPHAPMDIVNLVDKDCRTLLSWASEKGHEAVVNLLLKIGKADVNLKDNCRRTALSWASEKGHEVVVNLLLEIGKADVDLKDNYNRTALSWASEKGHEAVVNLLVEIGKADVDLKDNYHRTALSWAAGKGHEAVVKLLLETGKTEVNSKNKIGRTPLSRAATNGHGAVVKLLLASKAEVYSNDLVFGRTPLSWAASGGHGAVVKFLLETGKTEVNSQDFYGRTPLSWAAANEHEVIVKLLLNMDKIKVNLKDKNGRTALSWAIANGHDNIIKLLVH